MVPNIMYR